MSDEKYDIDFNTLSDVNNETVEIAKNLNNKADELLNQVSNLENQIEMQSQNVIQQAPQVVEKQSLLQSPLIQMGLGLALSRIPIRGMLTSTITRVASKGAIGSVRPIPVPQKLGLGDYIDPGMNYRLMSTSKPVIVGQAKARVSGVLKEVNPKKVSTQLGSEIDQGMNYKLSATSKPMRSTGLTGVKKMSEVDVTKYMRENKWQSSNLVEKNVKHSTPLEEGERVLSAAKRSILDKPMRRMTKKEVEEFRKRTPTDIRFYNLPESYNVEKAVIIPDEGYRELYKSVELKIQLQQSGGF